MNRTGTRLFVSALLLCSLLPYALFAARAQAGDPAHTSVPWPARSDSAGMEIDRYLEGLGRGVEDEFSPWVTSEPAWRSIPPESLGTRGALTRGRPRSPLRSRFLPRARYNRVEGLNLMPEVAIGPRGVPLSFFGSAGRGTSSEEWTYAAGVRAGSNHPSRGAGIELAIERDLRSFGTPPPPVNSFFAVVLGQDHGDYLLADGWRGSVRGDVGPFRVRTALRSEWHDSMARKASFTLLRGRHDFRENPRVDHGRYLLYEIAAERARPVGKGLRPSGRAVLGRRTSGGTASYRSWEGRLVYERPALRKDRVRLNLRGGYLTGETPFQALLHLGGPAGLRGYEVNEIHARRMVHAQVDYAIGTDLLAHVGLRRAAHTLRTQLVPFADAAIVSQTQERDPATLAPRVRDYDHPFWKFSVGIGLQQNVLRMPMRAGQIRIDLAWRLDRSRDNFTTRVSFTPAD